MRICIPAGMMRESDVEKRVRGKIKGGRGEFGVGFRFFP